ncbi:MAG: DUF3301 domain-containing protein [Steroidobacteraceae bacterium]
MQLGWSTLGLILIVTAIAWFWQNSLAARERANAAALDACERLSLQFLDGTVAFARIALVRNDHGRLSLQRTYVFDYTADSIERRQGFVVLTALRIESVGYARDEEVRRSTPEPRPPEPPLEPGPGASNVLKLDDWRGRRREPPENRAADRRH